MSFCANTILLSCLWSHEVQGTWHSSPVPGLSTLPYVNDSGQLSSFGQIKSVSKNCKTYTVFKRIRTECCIREGWGGESLSHLYSKLFEKTTFCMVVFFRLPLQQAWGFHWWEGEGNANIFTFWAQLPQRHRENNLTRFIYLSSLGNFIFPFNPKHLSTTAQLPQVFCILQMLKNLRKWIFFRLALSELFIFMPLMLSLKKKKSKQSYQISFVFISSLLCWIYIFQLN